MIIIKPKNIEVDASQLATFKKEFEQSNLFICPQLFDNTLKALIDKQFSITQFTEFVHKGDDGVVIGQEHVIPSDSALPKIINFYLNHKDVLDIVREISGISEIKSFTGRAYRFEANQQSFDNWHSDMSNGRLLGLSLNLTDKPYGGGEFNIRNASSKQLYGKVKHDKWGAAHFFRISDDLEHKVEKVQGEVPRVAFAGWFNSQPLFK